MPREIVVFEEKHENRYFDVEASGGWARVCMAVFMDRDREGYFEEPRVYEKPQPPADMEDASAVTRYAMALQQHAHREKQQEGLQKEWALVLKARQGDLWAAREIIESRRNGQYEGYSFQDVRVVSPEIPRFQLDAPSAKLYLALRINTLLAEGITPENRVEAEKILSRTLQTEVAPEKALAPASREDEREILHLQCHLEALLKHPGDIKCEINVYRNMRRRQMCLGMGPLPRYIQQYGSVDSFVDAYMDAAYPPETAMDISDIQRHRETIRALFQE